MPLKLYQVLNQTALRDSLGEFVGQVFSLPDTGSHGGLQTCPTSFACPFQARLSVAATCCRLAH